MSAYNSSDLVERAIRGILSQTFTDFELIILNDGSTDDTEARILSFDDKRIRYFSLDHAGLPKALNYGVAQAKSEIIVRHDSDDWSEPDRFALQVAHLEEDSDLTLIASAHNVVDVGGELLGYKPTAIDDLSLKKMLTRRSPFCHGSVAMRKSALAEVGGYNEAMLYSQDYDLWLRMAAAGMKFACSPEPLYNYSVTPESIAKGWAKLANGDAIRKNAAKASHLRDYVVDGVPSVSQRRTEALWNYAIGSLALDNDQRWRGFKYFLRSLYKSPFFWQAYFKAGLSLLPMSLANMIIGTLKRRLESKTDS